MAIKTLLFDFDGTLADTSKGIYKAFADSAKEIGLKPPTYSLFKVNIGPPINKLIPRFYSNINNQKIIQFIKLFREKYDSTDYKIFNWYDGFNSTIATIYNDINCQIGIVTNKPTLLTEKLIKTSNLQHIFEHIVGIDYPVLSGLNYKFESKFEALKYTIRLFNTQPENTIYVGDTPSDLVASRKNSIQFISATYGFHSWSQTEVSVKHINTLPEILPILKETS